MKLRSYLFSLALVAVLPLLAFSVVMTVFFFLDHLTAVKRGLVDTSRAISVAIDRKLAGSIDTLAALATSETLDVADFQKFRIQAERVLAAQEAWATVILAETSGRRILDLRRVPAAPPPPIDDSPFHDVLVKREPVVSDLIVDPALDVRSVYVAVPVIRQDQVRYVLIAGIEPSTLGRALLGQELPSDRVADIVDRKKNVIARSTNSGRLIGKPTTPELARQGAERMEGSYAGVGPAGVPAYVGFHRSALSGWTVAVGASTALVDAPLWRWLATVMLVGLGLVAVGVGGAWWFERRIRVPMVALSNSAEALARGEVPPVVPPSPIVEIASLSRSIANADRLLRDRAHGRERAEADLAEQLDQFSVTLSSIGDAVIATDLSGRVTFMNNIAQSMTGWTEAQAVGKAFDEVLTILDEESRESVTSSFARVIDDGTVVEVAGRTVLRSSHGTEIPIECRGAPRRDAKARTVGAVFVCRDVSERRRAEQERIEILSRANAARDEAQAANRAKDEFISMLGHELRNPLGAISNAVYALDVMGDSAASAVQARQVIFRGVEQLARMVDDLLDVARMTKGKLVLDRAPLNLAESVTQCVSALSGAGRTGRHRITLDLEPAWIEGDAVRVEQVFANLLINAIQYTPADGTIRVSVSASGNHAIVRVQDSGVGISAEMLPHVFDLFQQGDRTLDRPQGGLGIGLTLAQRLVEAHGGTIEAFSEGPGLGSTFTVRLSRVPAPAMEPALPSVQVQVPSRRILIVEDSQDARDMLRLYLTESGHQVYEAADGPGAVEVALRVRPDVALIDIGLPGLDGYEVVKRIRATPEGREMFLVALTGYGHPKDHRLAFEAGVDAYLVKPFDRDRLARLLAQAPRRS